jgi:deazaflavin-dependent oxidoreductase (nitroreductase family)
VPNVKGSSWRGFANRKTQDKKVPPVKENPLLKLERFAQSIWLDFIRRGMITSGEFGELIKEDGLRGVTSNPSISKKAVGGSHDYDQTIRADTRRQKRSSDLRESYGGRHPVAIWLYRTGLCWLLGNRLLMLTHIGRKSGLARTFFLEVIGYTRKTDTYFVAADFGAKSIWLRNICLNSRVTIHVGRRRFDATALRLSAEEARCKFEDYAGRHPMRVTFLSLVLGNPSGREVVYQETARRTPTVASESHSSL